MTATDPLFDLETVEDPYDYYAELRDRDPVHPLAGTGTYLVCTAELIHQVVADPDTFSSNSNAYLHVDPDGRAGLRDALGDAPIEGESEFSVLATADPPIHTRQRRVLSRVLSKGSVARLEQGVLDLVDDLLEPHLASGRVEWMSAIAEPVPAVIVARILGIEDHHAPFLKDTGFAAVEQIGGFAEEDRRAELRDLMTRLGPVGDAYERACAGTGPGPGTVIGACAEAVANGEMDDLEAISTLMMIVSAGTESTTSLLGTGARILAGDPDLQQTLRDDPDLIELFVEEALRIDPPFRGHYRRATHDTELNGVRIPAGSRLVLAWPAANRDPDVYDDAECVRLDRAAPRQHVGFGWGIHLCVGAPIARLEARVTFERLLARTTHVALDCEPASLRHHRSLMVRRLVELPLLLRN